MNPKCETCRWFARLGATARGECRARAPESSWTGQALWPGVHESDYCGFHEPAGADPPAKEPA